MGRLETQLRAFTELHDEIDRLPARYRVDLMASLVLLEEEITQLRKAPPPPTKVWARRWAGGITLRAGNRPEEGPDTVSTMTMPSDGIWFQVEVE